MVELKRLSVWERLLCRFSKKRRQRHDDATREAIRWLVEHPEAPCMIGGTVIPDGYGTGGPGKDAGQRQAKNA